MKHISLFSSGNAMISGMDANLIKSPESRNIFKSSYNISSSSYSSTNYISISASDPKSADNIYKERLSNLYSIFGCITEQTQSKNPQYIFSEVPICTITFLTQGIEKIIAFTNDTQTIFLDPQLNIIPDIKKYEIAILEAEESRLITRLSEKLTQRIRIRNRLNEIGSIDLESPDPLNQEAVLIAKEKEDLIKELATYLDEKSKLKSDLRSIIIEINCLEK